MHWNIRLLGGGVPEVISLLGYYSLGVLIDETTEVMGYRALSGMALGEMVHGRILEFSPISEVMLRG